MNNHVNKVVKNRTPEQFQRTDTATSATIEFAITLSALAGQAEAKLYLEGRNTSPEVIDRIFHASVFRRRSRPDLR